MRLVLLGALMLSSICAITRANDEASAPSELPFDLEVEVVGDARANVSTLDANPARNAIDLASVELELRGKLHRSVDAVLIMPVIREVEDELFFDPADAEENIEFKFEIEEAYLSLHDFGIANLSARAGRFHLRFGQQNPLHPHELPTVDYSFVNQSFLGHHAVSDNGLSVSYMRGEVGATVEVVSGEGSDEQPVINNGGYEVPSINTHLLWNRDLARDWNIELGGSWLTTTRNNDTGQHANLFGADVTLVHTDPAGGFLNQLIQLEAIYGDVDTSRDDTQHAAGAYLLLQQQIAREWYAGARFDWTENALDDTQEIWGVSPYVTWQLNESLRLRLQYQHRGGDVPSEETLYFQVTWRLGDHPPHAH